MCDLEKPANSFRKQPSFGGKIGTLLDRKGYIAVEFEQLKNIVTPTPSVSKYKMF
jgi:hypothetical protein